MNDNLRDAYARISAELRESQLLMHKYQCQDCDLGQCESRACRYYMLDSLITDTVIELDEVLNHA